MLLSGFRLVNWSEFEQQEGDGIRLIPSDPIVIGRIDGKLLVEVGRLYKDIDRIDIMVISADSLDDTGDFEMFSLERRLKFNPYGIELD